MDRDGTQQPSAPSAAQGGSPPRGEHPTVRERDVTASAAHPAIAETPPCVADRSAAVERARDEAYPDLRRATPRQLSGSGARQGWEAGQRADLGGERLHGGRRALPG